MRARRRAARKSVSKIELGPAPKLTPQAGGKAGMRGNPDDLIDRRKPTKLARGSVVRRRLDNVTMGESGHEVVAPVNDPRRSEQLLDNSGLLGRLPVNDRVDELAGVVATLARVAEQGFGTAPAPDGDITIIVPGADHPVLVGRAAVDQAHKRRARKRR